MPEGDGTKYGKYIVSELIMPESKQKIDADYRMYARRILWIDDDIVPGTFHMNTAWYLKAGPTLEDKPHVHDSDGPVRRSRVYVSYHAIIPAYPPAPVRGR